MLVNFVGSPSSGKTTVAASVFARLKEDGIAAEFVGEYARQYLATRRVEEGNTFVGLNDMDQIHIMQAQAKLENVMSKSGAEVVVTDSAPILSLLYMKEVTKDVEAFLLKTVKQMELVFYCPPLRTTRQDSNRVHGYAQSLEIDNKISPVFQKYAPGVKVISLTGPNEVRADIVLRHVYSRLAGDMA